MYTPSETADICSQKGFEKVQKNLIAKLLLGFIGGAMISLGYVAYMKIVAMTPEELSFLGTFIGAAVFPIGLIVILLAGGELVTGNMVAVASAWFNKKVSGAQVIQNWLVITLANFAGALFVAYFFGHLVGLTSQGNYLHELLTVADAKLAATPLQAFVSGIGCNWFVALGVWLSYGCKDSAGKILGIWFPIMIFVLLGFQHSVANMFVLSDAIIEGHIGIAAFFSNIIPVYFGNIVGGVLFVAFPYYMSYQKGH
ncbi:formate/nitrite transporter family protein [Enterococcus pseudoavium]|uniref:Formate/nitrite transporter family protein n=1 Tax=Enterococcus pseudoavium TaxID=44007 RepID=A0AAE4I2M1_9ENTE|nr:formate/nitrite transporter family protein [Enterococcus pseudoavium]MDT2736890.1 formate/nitrite transporter family protein [Enterococcus pseudoavium]MDT2754823.1 formate/nitrite transporter family protein [Enterococcus pseudoavium]MDT2770358.1 formate/nitrite transporter family protein [Enterococcus pseudoavium]REC33223.1 formate-nitrite transporter [Enterococcus pseudoavium]